MKPYLFAERALHVSRYLLEVLVDYGTRNRVGDIHAEVQPLCAEVNECLYESSIVSVCYAVYVVNGGRTHLHAIVDLVVSMQQLDQPVPEKLRQQFLTETKIASEVEIWFEGECVLTSCALLRAQLPLTYFLSSKT